MKEPSTFASGITGVGSRLNETTVMHVLLALIMIAPGAGVEVVEVVLVLGVLGVVVCHVRRVVTRLVRCVAVVRVVVDEGCG